MDDHRAVLRDRGPEPRKGNGELGLTVRSLLRALSGGRRGLIAIGIVVPFATPLYAPQLLAFPYRTATPIGTVWSETPIAPEILASTSDAVRARMATTPLADANERRPIFLTEGGWRWSWLAPGNGFAFALSRPLTKAVVVNRANLAGDAASGKPSSDRKRTLASLLAHEFTHGLIRRRYGEVASIQFPGWKVEGYADFVSGESTLSDAEAAALEAAGTNYPALLYFRGCQRVANELAANGGDVDALFTGE